MSRGVAEERQRIGVSVGEDRKGDVGLERPVQVPDLSVDAGSQGCPRKPGTNPFGDLPRAGAGWDLTYAAIGQRDAHCAHGAYSCTVGGTAGPVDGAKYR